jgi:hypothetical protein
VRARREIRVVMISGSKLMNARAVTEDTEKIRSNINKEGRSALSRQMGGQIRVKVNRRARRDRARVQRSSQLSSRNRD